MTQKFPDAKRAEAGPRAAEAQWRDRLTRINDSLGRAQTLSTGAASFARLGHGPEAVFMGLGPHPEEAVSLARGFDRALWLECPAFARAMRERDPSWPGELPANWREIAIAPAHAALKDFAPAELAPEELAPDRASVFFYRQNARLFPEFWGPLFARAQLAAFGAAPPPAQGKSVLLPGAERDLLHQELRAALADEGFAVLETPSAPDAAAARALLRERRPDLVLSVNMRGLDAETFYLLQALGVPTAIWMADNPWHILSQTRLPWWREAFIFTTDPSFAPALTAAGAARARFLPLGTRPELWTGPHNPVAGLRKTVFVGRSAFPAREKFFAAVAGNAELARLEREHAGSYHNFHWWMDKLNISRPWPGPEARRAGFMAEKSSLAHRTAWLRAARRAGLTVYGDSGWESLLGGEKADLRRPVDYYRDLPAIYASAEYSLNITSLLLPAALTQRHFDVWAAGGFLISDQSAGLALFPPELAAAIAVKEPGRLLPRLEQMEKNPGLRRDIKNEFHRLILEKHTYRHRINEIINTMNLN